MSNALYEWSKKKNPNDSIGKKVAKGVVKTGQYMLDNPSAIVGTQAGIIATGVTLAKLSSPKPKKMGSGLSNKPSGRVNVAKRYAKELSLQRNKADIYSRSYVDRGYHRSFERTYPKRIDQFNKSYTTGKAIYNNPNKPDRLISGNTGKNYATSAKMVNKVNKDLANFGRRYERLDPSFKKDITSKKLKRFKTMGKIIKGIKNITVPGIIGAIMAPTPAGQGSDLGKPIPKRYR